MDQVMEKRLRGSVKCFYRAKQFGFITANGVDYFVTPTRLANVNRKALGNFSFSAGQIVEFNVSYDEKGRPQARQVSFVWESSQKNSKSFGKRREFIESSNKKGNIFDVPIYNCDKDNINETDDEDDDDDDDNYRDPGDDNYEHCVDSCEVKKTISITMNTTKENIGSDDTNLSKIDNSSAVEDLAILARNCFGVIKSYKANKGFGFIHSEEYGNLFFHLKNCMPFDHCCKLRPGSNMQFDVARGNKKVSQAINVRYVPNQTGDTLQVDEEMNAPVDVNSSRQIMSPKVSEDFFVVRMKSDIGEPTQSNEPIDHLIHQKAFIGESSGKQRKGTKKKTETLKDTKEDTMNIKIKSIPEPVDVYRNILPSYETKAQTIGLNQRSGTEVKADSKDNNIFANSNVQNFEEFAKRKDHSNTASRKNFSSDSVNMGASSKQKTPVFTATLEREKLPEQASAVYTSDHKGYSLSSQTRDQTKEISNKRVLSAHSSHGDVGKTDYKTYSLPAQSTTPSDFSKESFSTFQSNSSFTSNEFPSCERVKEEMSNLSVETKGSTVASKNTNNEFSQSQVSMKLNVSGTITVKPTNFCRGVILSDKFGSISLPLEVVNILDRQRLTIDSKVIVDVEICGDKKVAKNVSIVRMPSLKSLRRAPDNDSTILTDIEIVKEEYSIPPPSPPTPQRQGTRSDGDSGLYKTENRRSGEAVGSLSQVPRPLVPPKPLVQTVPRQETSYVRSEPQASENHRSGGIANIQTSSRITSPSTVTYGVFKDEPEKVDYTYRPKPTTIETPNTRKVSCMDENGTASSSSSHRLVTKVRGTIMKCPTMTEDGEIASNGYGFVKFPLRAIKKGCKIHPETRVVFDLLVSDQKSNNVAVNVCSAPRDDKDNCHIS